MDDSPDPGSILLVLFFNSIKDVHLVLDIWVFYVIGGVLLVFPAIEDIMGFDDLGLRIGVAQQLHNRVLVPFFQHFYPLVVAHDHWSLFFLLFVTLNVQMLDLGGIAFTQN